MSDPILNGTNAAADRRLMEDVMSAPDPFDGGCPADVTPPSVLAPTVGKSFTDHMVYVAGCNARGDVYQTLCDSMMKAWDRATEAHFVAVGHDTIENSTTTRRRVKAAEGYRDGIRAALQIVLDAWHADNERRNKA
jgi:hypothetical protein